MITETYSKDVIDAILNITSNCTLYTKAKIRNKFAIGDTLQNDSSPNWHKDISYKVLYKRCKQGWFYTTFDIEEVRVYYKGSLIHSNLSPEDRINFAPMIGLKSGQVSFYDRKNISLFYKNV